MKIIILKFFMIIAGLITLVSYGASQSSQMPKQKVTPITELDYPVTTQGKVSENYFGTNINDPYRWLEDDLNSEVAEWVKEENELTQQYLGQIPYRQALASAYEKMLDYEKVSVPFPEGRYIYFYKNTGLQNQYVLYRQKDDSEADVFIDPNRFSDDGTVSMETVSFSSDGSLVAYTSFIFKSGNSALAIRPFR